MTLMQAPVCVQKPHHVTEHEDARYDPFYWLRSDSRDDAEVLAYLKAENAYCAEVLADTQGLQKDLYKEMRGRIQEADTSAPVPRDGYFYYRRTLEGKQYAVHCRRPIGNVGGPLDETAEVDPRCARPTCGNAASICITVQAVPRPHALLHAARRRTEERPCPVPAVPKAPRLLLTDAKAGSRTAVVLMVPAQAWRLKWCCLMLWCLNFGGAQHTGM